MKRILLIAMAGAIGFSACNKDDESNPVTPPVTTKNYLVVTVWNKSSDVFNVYRYDTTGANPVLLMNKTIPNNSYYAVPYISDDGKKIVYTNSDSIFIYDVAGTTSTFIYKHIDNWINAPILNPDGTKVAFIAKEPTLDYRSNMYMMNTTAGSVPVNITNTAWAYWIGGGNFSKDGQKITYTIGYNADNAVYISNIDGSNSFRVSESHGFGNSDNCPAFTADNNKVIYMSSRYSGYNGPFDLVISDAVQNSETTCTRLTTGVDFGVDYCTYPVVSKSGQFIYFIGVNSNASGPYNLYKMPLAGGTAVKLTDNTDANLIFFGVKEVKL